MKPVFKALMVVESIGQWRAAQDGSEKKWRLKSNELWNCFYCVASYQEERHVFHCVDLIPGPK